MSLLRFDTMAQSLYEENQQIEKNVNNLDLKITAPDGTTVYYPFVMPFVGTWTTESMASAATTGVNNVDNVEQVYIAAPTQPGTYSVSVSLPGSLSSSPQVYSLVVTGASANPPPVVTVTQPEDGAAIDSSTTPNVTVTATATDLTEAGSPGVVSAVECYAGGSLIGAMTEVSPGTYSLAFTPPIGPAVELRVTATDSEGASASDSVTISYQPPPNPPPVVEITSPASGAIIDPVTTPQITVTATATDLTARGSAGVVSNVECSAEGGPSHPMTLDPDTGIYSVQFAPPFGSAVVVSVTATDSEGESGSDSVTISYQYAQPGDLRLFTPPLVNGTVRALAGDGSNRIYIGGEFTKLNLTVDAPRVARLLSDGSVDATFNPGSGPDATVRVLAYDAARKGLYAGGDFRNVNGVARAVLVRFAVGKTGLTDGAIDPDFAPVIEASSPYVIPFVGAIAVQDDGRILVGGNFSRINNESRGFLARLLPDGSLDSGFAPVVPGVVNAIALQPDGKILIGGTFGEVNGVQRRNLARLNADGTLDTSLDVGTGVSSGFNGTVNSIAVALGGDIYVGGSFTTYKGIQSYRHLAKLDRYGSLFPAFNYLNGLDKAVYDVHLRPDGGVLVTGLFTSVSNRIFNIAAAAGRVVQLNSDGSLDADFNPGGAGANGSVLDSLALPDGDILLAGAFTTFNGTSRQNLAVIAGFDAAKPIVTSPSSHTIAIGDEIDFEFTANAPATFTVTGTLPAGVSFDGTSRLTGMTFEPGGFTLSVTPTTAQGTGDAAGFWLQVNTSASPLSGFSAWIEANFTTEELADPSVWGPNVVLNPLGLSNFAVYALDGGDPRLVSPSAIPVLSRETIEGEDYLVLTAPKNPDAADVVYTVEYSTDLASWPSDGADVVIISDTPTEIKARAAVPAGVAPRQFLRLRMVRAN